MITSLRFFYLSFLLICAASAVAQTGPGGVGNATGSSGQPQNRLWLRADAGTSTSVNNAPVSSWSDQSGNGNVASQTGAARPTYQSGVVNGKPVLRFNTSGGTASQSIRVNSALGVAQTGGFHYFIVTKRNGTLNSFGSLGTGGGPTGGVYLLDRTTATTPLASLKALPGNLYGFQKRDNASSIGGVSSTTQIDGTNFQIVNYQRQRGVAYRLFLNGTQEGGDLTDADGDLLPPLPASAATRTPIRAVRSMATSPKY
ncbi:MAG: hypothetical protein HY22_09065 [[Candidatus Thermochlorobacteriaceae] bacterium GBChlB]|nr:MAG: hypothetical protein HY22_09065 [[Candidatus Thermochlorobacteriaceae] bacterium GBChlB]